MKQSLNTHDIYALVQELKNWIGFRVLNIYDIDLKTICIKFNSVESKKKYLIIESGTKFYSLDNFTAIKDIPGSFCSKLRKHLNNKRLESINQVNIDRVVDLQFGTNELAFHLIGEFYASGNIIFTDHEYKILTLLHPHTYKINESKETKEESIINTQIKVSVGNIYPFDYSTQKIDLNQDSIKEMFETNLPLVEKKIKLKQFIPKLPIIKFSLNVIEHSFKKISIDMSQKISNQTKFEDIFYSSEKINQFIDEVKILFETKKFTGFKTVDNFYPFEYSHLNLKELKSLEKYETFLKATSIFFQTIKPIETKEIIKTKQAEIKLSKQEKVIYNIEQQVKSMEENIKKIENQIDTITSNLGILEEIFSQANNINPSNPIINVKNENLNLIGMCPYKKLIKLKLTNYDFEFDYSKSVFVNLEKLFEKNKKIKDKNQNAILLLEKEKKKLIKKEFNTNTNPNPNTETNLDDNFIKGQIKSNWFEQFNWFFTSDNLLFISGKTADQNELLVKKYLEQDDLYIHSDTFGSGSGILKNSLKINNIHEICPKSLIESGTFLISHTKSWSLGSPDSAYWVKPSQVSKTPESGEYITKGSFIIRGQKNPIPVSRMELGFGIVFKVIGKEGFVGVLEKDDKIEYALPIVSTYSAQYNYKFKVKIIPGTQKIKKALPEVIYYFIKKATHQEIQSIKKISNDSIQKVLISGIRFVIQK
jgi:predicted ribosome quality control (RQC) complex YloA/Tae2 family protein